MRFWLFVLVLIGFLGAIGFLGIHLRRKFQREYAEAVEKADRIVREVHRSIPKVMGAEFMADVAGNPSWRAEREGKGAIDPAVMVGDIACGDRIIKDVERSWILMYATPDPRADFGAVLPAHGGRRTWMTLTVRKPQGLIGGPPEITLSLQERGSRLAVKLLLETLAAGGIPAAVR